MNKLLLAIIVFCLILLLSITLLSGVITAQPPLPSGAEAKARWWPDDLSPVPLPHSPIPALGNRTPSSLSTITGLPDWTRIAFQSYRDGNWEIYLARGDGSQPVRLTDHPAADMRPRLNRGATRLAFTTDRDGNFEIYTMNTDGSGLARLTFHGASDTGPAWSPDGGRIAFASDRDGNAEIYVMNADGSSQTRLTHNSADDLMPAWSPDGSRIAWVRRSGLDGAIWVMNADGGNPHALTGLLRFLQHPVWSPDGAHLAFDYDADSDFWNELAVINADGTGLRTMYDPSRDLVDAWTGSWSPDGEWLLFSWVEYVIQDDELFFRNTYIERASVTSSLAERLPGSGYDLLPDWETADISPPWVYIQPLPRYLRSRDGAIPLQWSGGDVGPAGLRSYDVQYWEEPSGPWLTLLDHALTRSATLMGTLGHTYAFRARARDYAGNVSPWSSGLRNRTTLYAWHLIGTVTDNRDVPIGGAAVETAPASINTVSSGFDGRFQVYLAEVASTTVTVGKEGYNTLPAVILSGDDDVEHWWALPPTDDYLANGGFEGGSLSPWQASGSFPVTLDRSLAHTGGTSAMLGQPLTLEVTNISNNSDSSGFFGPPRIARDPAGNLHVVWADMSAIPGDMTSGTGDIFYSMQSPNGTWTTEAIPVSDDDRRYPVDDYLAADPDGRIHVAWTSRDRPNNITSEVRYRVRSLDGLWSAPVRISRDQAWADGPGLWADARGQAHIVWYEGPPNGNTEVLYTSVERARAGDATLTQAVTLPVDLHRPTLSFAYRLDIVAGTGGYLEAAVNGTPVFSATVPTEDWTHAWVDLSAWTGQAVTVSFIAHRTEVSGPVVAHLDDVSLGSWLTPVIHDVSPSHTEAWAATPITVTGENFIATPALRLNERSLDDVQWVDERTLTATLPADLPPGVYNVRVTNPGGQEAVLAGGLRAGWQVYLPAVLKGHTP